MIGTGASVDDGIEVGSRKVRVRSPDVPNRPMKRLIPQDGDTLPGSMDANCVLVDISSHEKTWDELCNPGTRQDIGCEPGCVRSRVHDDTTIERIKSGIEHDSLSLTGAEVQPIVVLWIMPVPEPSPIAVSKPILPLYLDSSFGNTEIYYGRRSVFEPYATERSAMHSAAVMGRTLPSLAMRPKSRLEALFDGALGHHTEDGSLRFMAGPRKATLAADVPCGRSTASDVISPI